MTPKRLGNSSYPRKSRTYAPIGSGIDEFLGSYVQEFRHVVMTAYRRHHSLVGVFECPDAVFYDTTATERLRYFSLDGYSIVTFRNSRSTSLAIHLPILTRPIDVECGGLTHVLTSGTVRHTSIFIRKSIGLSPQDDEVEAMIKLVVLLHELGHVRDIEGGTNFGRHTVDPLNAEVYAHHFACRAMIKDKYRIALGWYLDQLAEMKDDEAAVYFSNSPEFGIYQREISPWYRQAHTMSDHRWRGCG